MLYLVLSIVILFLVILITSFITRFTLVRVDGESMSPTYKNGQFLIVDRYVSPKYHVDFGDKVGKGKVLVYFNPRGHAVIKRLHDAIEISEGEYVYWFEGDNKLNSIDSREYGYIQQSAIVGEVINFSTFLKRTFSTRGELKEEIINDRN